MRLNYRTVNILLVFASFVGMGFALYLEHVKGLNPCPLCIFQRVGLMAMGLFALIALLHQPRQRPIRIFYSLLTSIAIGWSFAVAARHVWIQHLPPAQAPSCGPGLNYLIDTLPFKSLLREVLTGSGECAKIDWSLWGLSLPTWSFVFFAGLLLLSLWQLLRR
jgi:disulfide bond formation protein DsbB